LRPDRTAIAIFADVPFGQCDRSVAVRQVAEKGGKTQPARTPLFLADHPLVKKQCRGGRIGVFVVPGTVANDGKARAADVVAIQAVLVTSTTAMSRPCARILCCIFGPQASKSAPVV
jgi:hypothetical protein